MNNVTTMAISKAISASTKVAKEARNTLTVGSHPVHAMVNLDGVLNVEADQEITPTASILNEEFLITVLHCAGITREAALKAVKEVADTYLVDWQGTKDDKKAAKAARKAKVEQIDPEGKLSDIFTAFKASLPKIPRAGKVTFKGDVSEVAMPVVHGVQAVESEVA